VSELEDDKNVRRRIYDALNVLFALDIISKDRKQIRWNGIELAPGDELKALRAESQKRRDRLDRKRATLENLALQFLGRKHVFVSNTPTRWTRRTIFIRSETACLIVVFPPNFRCHLSSLQRLNILTSPLRYVGPGLTNSCSLLVQVEHPKRSKLFMDFSQPFAVHDDNAIFEKIGRRLASSTPNIVDSTLRACLPSYFPAA